MAESVQVPRDLLERLGLYGHAWWVEKNGVDNNVLQDLSAVRALLASSGVGSPEQPDGPLKTDTDWDQVVRDLFTEGHHEECDRVQSAGEWPLYPCSCAASPVPVQPEPQTPAWKWSDDGGEYVRKHYDVPAHTNGRVIADGRPGVIVGFEEQYLRVVLDGEADSGKWHPTWHMEYLSAVQPQTEED